MVIRSSILETLKERQKLAGAVINVPDSKSRIAFLYPSKDRAEASRQTLMTLDSEKGFDLLWVDGSETPEGRALTDEFRPRNFHLIEVLKDVKGKDKACYLGMDKLFAMGYDYIGLVENELSFEPGWFRRLLQLFELAAEEGLAVGEATVRNFNSRVIEYRDRYTINWNTGAGMALWSRAGFQLIRQMCDQMSARKINRFYAESLGIDLGEALFRGRPDRMMSCDWTYEVALYQNGLAAVGSIPSLVRDLVLDVKLELGDSRVEQDVAGKGLARRKISGAKLFWIRLTDPLYPLAWSILKKLPSLYRSIQKIMAQGYQKKIVKINSEIPWDSFR